MTHRFGGDWTEKKLNCIEKYLHAYTTALSGKSLKIAYIDAFAGTGYQRLKDDDTGNLFLPELAARETTRFLEGSTQRALKIKPPFDKYIFVLL